ncbi:MAG TPA: hypothetical protein VFA20_00820 [Myxococcaceae bacterium]|nr:hypothetical protein [Myxococcaceae bacterium]
MPWSFQIRIQRARPCLGVVAFLAALARGAEPAASPFPAHPQVMAAEALYQRHLPGACDVAMKSAWMAPGLTSDDLIHLHFLTALMSLDAGDDPAARRALSQALRIDRSAEPAPVANRLRQILEETRAQWPADSPRGDDNSRQEADRKAVAERKPATDALLETVDALYGNLQVDGAVEGAIAVLDLAKSLAAQDRAKVAVRRGVMLMESAGDEPGARAAFREALEADRGVSIPKYAPPKTRRLFQDVTQTVTPAQPSSPAGSGGHGNPLVDGSRPWGLAAGGAGLALLAGGAVAGAIALSSYQTEQQASANAHQALYLQSRDTAKTARNVANGLYGAGAVALGLGAYLFLRAPGQVQVAAGAGPGQASITLGGHF